MELQNEEQAISYSTEINSILLTYLKAFFFVRYSSEYEKSRIVTERLTEIYSQMQYNIQEQTLCTYFL